MPVPVPRRPPHICNLVAAAVLVTIVVCAPARFESLSAEQANPPDAVIVLVPDRVFDGRDVQSGWSVVVRGERVEAAGPSASARPARSSLRRFSGLGGHCYSGMPARRSPS